MLDNRIKTVGTYEALRELDEALDLLKEKLGCVDDTHAGRAEEARLEGYEEGHEDGGAEERANKEEQAVKYGDPGVLANAWV
jgi:hypothetical protein